MNPLVASALIQGGTTLAGSLMNKKNKPKTPDFSSLIPQVNNAADKRGNIAASLTGKLAPVNEDFGNKADTLVDTLTAKSGQMGQQYLRDASGAASKLGANLSDQLKQRVGEAQPMISRGLRSNLAATGGLSRGSANTAFREQATEAGRQIGQGEQELANQELASRQKAFETVFNADQDTLARATGLDYQTLQSLVSMGRQDLISEAAELIAAEQDRANGLLGIAQNQMTAGMAADAANVNRKTDLISTLTGAGSNLATAAMLSRGEAPVAKPMAPAVQYNEQEIPFYLRRNV